MDSRARRDLFEPCLEPPTLQTYMNDQDNACHSNVRDQGLVCPQCNTDFRHKSDFERHKRSQHRPEPEFICGELAEHNGRGCGRKFKRRDALQPHRRARKGRCCQQSWDRPSLASCQETLEEFQGLQEGQTAPDQSTNELSKSLSLPDSFFQHFFEHLRNLQIQVLKQLGRPIGAQDTTVRWLKRALAEIGKQISNIPVENLLPSSYFTSQVEKPDRQFTSAPQADLLVEDKDPLISANEFSYFDLLKDAEAELRTTNAGSQFPEPSNLVSEASTRGSLEFESFEDLEETGSN